MCRPSGRPACSASPLDRPPPRGRDPDPHDRDRAFATAMMDLTPRYRQPSADEPGKHSPAEAMAVDQQLL